MSYDPDCEDCTGSLFVGLARRSCAVCGLGKAVPMGGLVVFVGAVLMIAHFCVLGALFEGVRDFFHLNDGDGGGE